MRRDKRMKIRILVTAESFCGSYMSRLGALPEPHVLSLLAQVHATQAARVYRNKMRKTI
jgi:hypothetical protein